MSDKKKVDLVRYVGCEDTQVAWGNNDDPRDALAVGDTYEVECREVHTWHTKIKLIGFDGIFNSVCFEDIEASHD